MKAEHFILQISRYGLGRSPNHGEETKTQNVWSHLTILWHREDNSARDSEMNKVWKTEKEMGTKNEQEWSLEIP